MELLVKEILFAKVKPDAKIPRKETENAGYDLYACFDKDFMVIPANSSVLIPTGIASAFSPKYYVQFEERGSTGVKGIKKSAGVIDSGFRGEWFVCLYNSNCQDIIISKLSFEELQEQYALVDSFGDSYIQWGKTVNESTYLFDFNDKLDIIIYPYEKAIAQAIIHEVPEMIVCEIDYEDLLKIPSKRRTGQLGSSGK